ncbi:MAG: hypothetical protein FWF92_03020 [Oscillospiraceae bacterium]|nr:hypothetical protein [Oscillospiraceae bacterium]
MKKMKKIISFIIILAMLAGMVVSLSSCEKPEIYTLIENILENKTDESYYFSADLNIKINEEYLDEAMPKEMTFEITGEVWDSEANILVNLVQVDGEKYYGISMWIDKFGDRLYVDLNDLSKIILDLLYSTGFIDAPVIKLFENEIAYNYSYSDNYRLCFDLTDFDLDFFDKYIKNIEKIFTIKSSVNDNITIDRRMVQIDEPNDSFYFSDIKPKIDKELLKLPGYRYYELYVVIETDENKNNFMNILAIRENGKIEILDKIKLDCDLSKVRNDPESIYGENIIPMRYLLELLGETVGWDNTDKKAYKIKDGGNIYFEGNLIKSKTYISLLEIMVKTDYMLSSVAADEYIEFKLRRK